MAIEPDALKLSFQLTAQGDHLQVRATARRGEGRAETAMPSVALLSQLAEFDPAGMPLAALQPAGQSLYHCLAVGDVARLAADVLLEARAARQPAQFELRFDPDQVALAQHPWEIIADDLGQFLVRDGLVDVTRYVTYPQPPPALSMVFRDKTLLRVVSQPTQLPPLAIGELPLSCQMLAHATFESLSEKLLIERLALWGLQFDGHGALVQRCPQCDTINMLDAPMCAVCGAQLSGASQVGVLAFESNGSIEWVPAQELGSILYNAQVQLAMLLACETARLAGQWMFSGLAPSLMLAGVPAVIGMQYPVSDRFANSFAISFYKALLRQNDVLVALRVARQMNVRAAWYSPVLYLRHRKTTPADEVIRPAYHTRNIDTAVPAQARAGSSFLVRLWIRRPQTRPLTTEQLREELNVPATVPISTREAQAEIKFEPIPVEQRPPSEKRKLRRGEVEVKLTGTDCRITPESIKLFVDEDLDAPPAIFTVRAETLASLSLIFSLWQEGGQIASVTHHVNVTPDADARPAAIKTGSQTIPVEDVRPVNLESGRAPDELVGKILGKRYQIVEVMARGGMTTVYKAYQSDLERFVTLKVTPGDWADKELLARFEQGVRALARLRHPHIIGIYDYGQEGRYFFTAEEYLSGVPLNVLLQQGPLPLARVANILTQVASALDYAHAQGVLHRNIQPGYIIVDEKRGDHVVLTGFGLPAAWQPSVTGAVAALLEEAPQYVAPERVAGQDADARTDVYSLGVVVYQALAGTVPFARSTPMATWMAIVTDPPPPLSQFNPNVPPAVEAAILKALSKNRDERFHSAGELASALYAAITERKPRGQGRPDSAPTTLSGVPAPAVEMARSAADARESESTMVGAPLLPPSSSTKSSGCRPGFSTKGLLPWLVLAIAVGMVILFGICLVIALATMASR